METSAGTAMTSGDWVVKEGKEEEFIEAWSELVRWALDAIPGARGAYLIQQDDNPRHFISVGSWAGKDAIGEWRGHPDFPKKLGAARELCDDFHGLDYTSVVNVSAE